MVFLRLTVKVYPRDQAPPSNTFSFRSLLGDRERDDASRTSSNTTVGKPASFLIVLENSEDVTLGGLAGMIREKWRKLRPNVEPLTIKKLLDDDHESDDLDTDMTVADVFVDKGKAKADGLDQRRTVRVIQKPAGGDTSPVRFPSVTQDWDAAAEHYEIQRQKKQKQDAELAVNKLGRIEEEGDCSRSPVDFNDWAQWTPNHTHRRDIPVFSVEKDHEIPASPSQPAPHSSVDDISHEVNGEDTTVHQEKRFGSEELGDSPRSSRATTPRKKSTPRRDLTASRESRQPENGDAPVSDSPGLQLVREHTHSVSPQKAPVAEPAKPDAALLAKEGQSETESESDDESENESEKENQDKDGDTAMRDQTSPRQSKSPIRTRARATAVEIPATSPNVVEQSRKRKNSTDQTSPNKEPRLERTTPPPRANSERRDSVVSPGTPRFSPSGKRLGGTESFSGVARRLSFSERGSEPPSHGLGLGITHSPSKRPSVGFESQKSTKSTEIIPASVSIPPSSAPVGRRGSISKNVSTSNNLQTPADKVKDIHSALRKDASADRSSVRRSVSFVDGDELLITGSQPAPTSTPMDGVNPTKSKAGSTAGSEKRRSSSSMVFPPGVSMEKIAQFEREAEAKFAQQKKEETEFQDKIKAAEKDKTKESYCNQLKEAFKTWKALHAAKPPTETAATRLRSQLSKQQAEMKKMEASFQDKGKEPQPFRESPASQRSSTNDAPSSSKKTPAPTVNGDRKSPAANNSGWNPINSPAKAATPTSNDPAKSTAKSTPKEPVAKTVATRTLTSKQNKPTSQSQNSTSDELELPAMKVQARTNANGTKKPSLQKPVDVDSSTSSASSSESEEEEGSSGEDSGSESESGSGSESESESESSESEAESKPNNTKKLTTATAPKSQLSKPTSPPSAQRTTKSPAPSSQSQSQPWGFSASQKPKSDRLSLSQLKNQVADQAKAQAAAKAKAAPQKRGPPRKDMFSPPSSDSDETESESSSESEDESEDDKSSSDSDDDNSKGKKADDKNRKSGRSLSPASVADAGDIMSSGRVQKLRTARMGGR